MPITTATAPPARRNTPTAAKPTVKANLHEKRTEAIGGFGQIAQGVLIATRQYADAGAIGMYFPAIADEIATLADADEKIAKLVDPLLQVGPYAGLISAVLPLAMQLMVNHGRAQAGPMGTVPATLLESQMKTRIAKLELELKRQQRDAELELKRMESEFASQN